MALRDVKQYYVDLLSQYIDFKNDLADFDKALQDGYITEDRMSQIKDEIAQVKENIDRIAYILYLFNLPQSKEKQNRYIKINKNLADYFPKLKADEQSILDESADVINHLRAELKQLNHEGEK